MVGGVLGTLTYITEEVVTLLESVTLKAMLSGPDVLPLYCRALTAKATLLALSPLTVTTPDWSVKMLMPDSEVVGTTNLPLVALSTTVNASLSASMTKTLFSE